jgi:hypothetical protein
MLTQIEPFTEMRFIFELLIKGDLLAQAIAFKASLSRQS